MERFERIDEKIQEGYALILENDYVGGCDRWLEAWDEIKELLSEGVANDLDDLNKKHKWTQYPSNYVQDAEEELHNAGLDDSTYHQKRITFCQELLQWSGTDELLAGNARISMAEAYAALGDGATVERLYTEWLRDDPDWGWGYIGWAEYYRFNGNGKQDEKAEEVLLAGYARDGLRDKAYVTSQLVELYTEMGKPDKAREYKKILSAPTRVVKVGRNDPCPCGSGKKYKKCCGA